MRGNAKSRKLLTMVLLGVLAGAVSATAQGTLFVEGEFVGINKESPAVELDVSNRVGSDRTIIAFNIGGFVWRNTALDNGTFFFNRLGSGDTEFRIRHAHHADATLVAAGHVQGTSFKNTSSREAKTDFEAIDPSAVLAKLAALPVTAWRYRTEQEDVRHVGPVAEDFQSLFGLGDGKTISTVDASGVMMAAIQGLVVRMDEALATKDAEIEMLKTELQALREALVAP